MSLNFETTTGTQADNYASRDAHTPIGDEVLEKSDSQDGICTVRERWATRKLHLNPPPPPPHISITANIE